MTVDTHRQMTELGSTPVPDPDPVFATQLELKLRAARVGATAPEIVRPRRWPATIAGFDLYGRCSRFRSGDAACWALDIPDFYGESHRGSVAKW